MTYLKCNGDLSVSGNNAYCTVQPELIESLPLIEKDQFSELMITFLLLVFLSKIFSIMYQLLGFKL